MERVNLSISYDAPTSADEWLHRAGRAGRFGTKGLAILMTSSEEDKSVLSDIQSRFSVEIPPLPQEIDAATYMS